MRDTFKDNVISECQIKDDKINGFGRYIDEMGIIMLGSLKITSLMDLEPSIMPMGLFISKEFGTLINLKEGSDIIYIYFTI